MSAFFILFSRPLFVTVLASAAVVSFIICPHAAKAYPTVLSVESGGQPVFRPQQRYSLLPSEPGAVSDPETAQRWRDPNRDGPSVIYHQPNLLLRNRHLSYKPNTPDDGQYHEGMTHTGQGLGGVKSASSISTSYPDRQPSAVNYNPFLHTQTQNGGMSGFVAPHNGNSQSGYHYNRHPPIIRKSSQQERPLPQSASQAEAQKPYDYDTIPRSGTSPFESRSEDEIVWQSPGYSPSSFSGYWSSQSVSQEHNSDNKEGNAGVRLMTSGVQSSKFPFFYSQSAPIAPSVSSNLDSNVFNSEKLTSSITHLSQGIFPPKSDENSNYKRVQSYILRDSHTSNPPKGGNAHNFPHSVYRDRDIIQPTRAELNLFKANTVLLHNANGTRFDGRTGDIRKYQPMSIIYGAPKTDSMTPHNLKEVQANREVHSHLGAVHPNGNGQPKESFSPSTEPTPWPILRKNSQPTIEATSESRSYRIMRPFMLQKYSFGQRLASSTATHEKTSRPFSSDSLDATPVTSKSLPFQEVPLMLHQANATNSNSGSVFRGYKRPHEPEGYRHRPLSAVNFNQAGNGRDKAGGLRSVTSTQEQNKPKTDHEALVKSVTLTRVKPALFGFKMSTPQSKRNGHETNLLSFSGQHVLGKDTKNVTAVQRLKLKPVTYYDIIGSASFSSVMPTGRARSRDHFDDSRQAIAQKEVMPQTVNLTDVMVQIGNASRSPENETERNSVNGNMVSFRKGEAETQLERSDLTMDETESEAKSDPQDLPSDPEGSPSESLLELDYLRTSTGNVSFQSINLNL